MTLTNVILSVTEDVLDVLGQIAATSKRTEKLSLLRSLAASHPGSQELLRLALDPHVVFYLTVDEEEMAEKWAQLGTGAGLAAGVGIGGLELQGWWDRFGGLCGVLIDRRVTGNEATLEVCRLMVRAGTERQVRWACRVLNKDLRAGIAAKTVNAVWPGLVGELSVALCESFDPERLELEGSWIFEPKLDGNRSLVARGRSVSRNGKEYTSFPHIVELVRELSEEFLVDGEVMGGTEFNAGSGKIRRKGGREDGIVFNAFDLVPIGEWESGNFVTGLLDRKRALREAVERLASPLVVEVPWTIASDPTSEQFFQHRDHHMSSGFEGAIAKRAESTYFAGRSDAWVKVKRFDTVDGRIVDVRVHRKRSDWLGAILVEINGVGTWCGSGFTNDQRALYWIEKEDLIDRVAELEFQELTPDGKLRFPTFKRFRPDKR